MSAVTGDIIDQLCELCYDVKQLEKKIDKQDREREQLHNNFLDLKRIFKEHTNDPNA